MFIKIILFPFKIILLIPIYIYKYIISPCLPKTCGYTPSCSNYMLIAIKRFGPIKGLGLGIKRILRCNPKAKGGFDPVPDNIKGELKWLI